MFYMRLKIRVDQCKKNCKKMRKTEYIIKLHRYNFVMLKWYEFNYLFKFDIYIRILF